MEYIKDETYYLHQTPNDLAKELIKKVPLIAGDKVVDTFRGEGAFYNNFPQLVPYSELKMKFNLEVVNKVLTPEQDEIIETSMIIIILLNHSF